MMKNVIGLAILLLTGCAWVPQKLTLAPQVQVPPSQAGNGNAVVVSVRDGRSSLQIGYRGMDSKGAEITTDQDLAAILQQNIIEGLTRQGFKATASRDEPGRILKVELRELVYSTDMDFWRGTIRARALLKVYSKAESGVFDHLYSAEREQKSVEAPRATKNAQLINGVLSEVLQHLLGDPKLVNFLAN